MTKVEKVWRLSFADAVRAIPVSWVVCLDDGFLGIRPEYRDEPITKLYHSLACTGYAKGWL